MQKKLLGLLWLLLTPLAYAFVVQCPSNTQFVYAGATIDEVVAACGTPTTELKSSANTTAWTYVLVAFSLHRAGVTLYFQENTVHKIVTSQGIEKQSLSCPNGSITLGSSEADVLNACGQPTRRETVPGSETEQVTLIYKTPQTYPEETAFHFVNGRLT